MSWNILQFPYYSTIVMFFQFWQSNGRLLTVLVFVLFPIIHNLSVRQTELKSRFNCIIATDLCKKLDEIYKIPKRTNEKCEWPCNSNKMYEDKVSLNILKWKGCTRRNKVKLLEWSIHRQAKISRRLLK